MKKIMTDNKGGALLISLCLLGMLTLVAIMAVQNSNTDINLSFNQLNADKALYIAEAGLKRALVDLNANDDWRSGYASQSFGQGNYTVALTDSLSDSTLFDTVIVRSTGTATGARSMVELWTVPIYIYPFHFALFGDKGINMAQNTCTDSYNSDSGSYASTVVSEQGSVGSNTSITTSKDVTIGGNAETAIGGTITLGTGNVIAGDTSTTRDSVFLEAIPDSEFVWARDNSIAQSSLSGVNYTYNNGNRTLTAGAYGTIILQSGVYFFSSITLGQGSEIVLAAGASVNVYVTGDIILGQGSKINSGGAPSDLLIFSQGTKLQFDQNNEFYGAFYGPNAVIQYDQTSQVFGSLVGSQVGLDQFACMHYDRNLAKITHGTTGEMLPIAWKEL